jgi:cell division protein FtsI (penicillin-binding protein 3)
VGGDWVQNPIDPGRRVVSESAARRTLRMLEGVVSATGTGRRAALRGVRVGGKTGTAQKLDVETHRYSHSDYLAWFIGIVPAEDPKLAITVVLDEPQGLASGGGDAAAPLFAEVAAAQLSHFGIVTKPARIRAVPFPTLLAKEKTASSAASRHEIESTPRGRSARERSVTGLAPASRSSASQPKLRSTAAEGTPASIRLSAATSVSSPRATRLSQPLRNIAPARFVPDFRGETAASAIHMADQDSFDLELVGDRRGLAVEQHPVPGTVVTGDRPRVRLRFTLGMEEG